jgi:hypothetical protein
MNTRDQPSQKAQETLNALREAVAKDLEKKRRLGQYCVFWIENRPVAIGDDAPLHINEESPAKY